MDLDRRLLLAGATATILFSQAVGAGDQRATRPEARMKAVVVGSDGAGLAEVETPAPKPTDVLVRVRAAALNRADLAVAAG